MYGRWRFAKLVGAGIPALLLAGVVSGAPKKTGGPTLTPQVSGTAERLQAVSPVNDQVVWASGTGGTYALTTDGGATWVSAVVPGAETLQFRDVEGVSAEVAYLMAAGTGTDSRIYKTEDGGATWTLQILNTDPAGFYDCFAFWTPTTGLTMADSVAGRLPVLRTLNGSTWQDIGDKLPPALPGGEFAFAASGTCLVTSGRDAWFASGGGAARVFHSRDGGATWTVTTAPIPAAEAGGVFSLAFRNPRDGVMVGGDFTAPANGVRASGFSHDGGASWQQGGDLSGYRSGVDWVTFSRATLIAVGPTGSDVSEDGGRSWRAFDATPFDAVDCVPSTCWASGPNGAVAVLRR
jgi:photosystem II stability/assembly factor-like uncharacterized protein